MGLLHIVGGCWSIWTPALNLIYYELWGNYIAFLCFTHLLKGPTVGPSLVYARNIDDLRFKTSYRKAQ